MDRIIDLSVENRNTIRDIRAQIEKQTPQQIKTPIAILGDPAKRVEVGHFPIIPKDLTD